jgi:hypothetical protein
MLRTACENLSPLPHISTCEPIPFFDNEYSGDDNRFSKTGEDDDELFTRTYGKSGPISFPPYTKEEMEVIFYRPAVVNATDAAVIDTSSSSLDLDQMSEDSNWSSFDNISPLMLGDESDENTPPSPPRSIAGGEVSKKKRKKTVVGDDVRSSSSKQNSTLVNPETPGSGCTGSEKLFSHRRSKSKRPLPHVTPNCSTSSDVGGGRNSAISQAQISATGNMIYGIDQLESAAHDLFTHGAVAIRLMSPQAAEELCFRLQEELELSPDMPKFISDDNGANSYSQPTDGKVNRNRRTGAFSILNRKKHMNLSVNPDGRLASISSFYNTVTRKLASEFETVVIAKIIPLLRKELFAWMEKTDDRDIGEDSTEDHTRRVEDFTQEEIDAYQLPKYYRFAPGYLMIRPTCTNMVGEGKPSFLDISSTAVKEVLFHRALLDDSTPFQFNANIYLQGNDAKDGIFRYVRGSHLESDSGPEHAPPNNNSSINSNGVRERIVMFNTISIDPGCVVISFCSLLVANNPNAKPFLDALQRPGITQSSQNRPIDVTVSRSYPTMVNQNFSFFMSSCQDGSSIADYDTYQEYAILNQDVPYMVDGTGMATQIRETQWKFHTKGFENLSSVFPSHQLVKYTRVTKKLKGGRIFGLREIAQPYVSLGITKPDAPLFFPPATYREIERLKYHEITKLKELLIVDEEVLTE